MTLFSSALAFLSFAAAAAAHGSLKAVAIDGVVYKGNVPNDSGTAQFASPIRLIDDISPVKNASNPNLSCGQNAKAGTMVAPAAAGAQITFQWQSGTLGDWPHNIGPMMTYMASCGDVGCDQFDASGAQWFKIDQVGLETSDPLNWWQNYIMQGQTFTTVIPQNIQPGGYLVRHEIIALHNAINPGGAEFYPACVQLNVSGSGTGTPSSTVSFPGAYSDSEAGILVPDIFNPGFQYTFAGPPVDALATIGSDFISATLDGLAAVDPSTGAPPAAAAAPVATETAIPAASGAASNASASAAPSATAAAAGAGSGGSSTCGMSSGAGNDGYKLRRHTASGALARRGRAHSGRMSRIMRRLLAELELTEAELGLARSA